MRKEVLRVENLAVFADDKQTLCSVYLNMFKGESIALIGLDGSGANLFINVLCGTGQITRGRILIDERSVKLHNELDSRFFGIYRVSQEQTLVNGLSVAENIFIMRRNSLKNTFVNRKMINSQSRRILERLGIYIQPSIKVDRLTIAEKHLIELAKAVSSGAKIIIFEECFASYNRDELVRLKTIVEQLKKEDLSFIFRCHYIDEVRMFSEMVIFFKDGQISKKTKSDKLDNSMITDYVLGYSMEKDHLPICLASEEIVLDAENIKLFESMDTISFSVRRGEVLGLLLTDVKKKETLAKMLSGEPVKGGGIIRLKGQDLRKKKLKRFHKNRIVLISDLGHRNELFYNMSIEENLLLCSLKKVSGIAGVISKKIPKMLRDQFAQHKDFLLSSIEETDKNTRIAISLERWLIYRPEVIVLMEPYLRADAVGESLITTYIKEFAKYGTSVIVVSSRPHNLEKACNHVLDMDSRKTLDEVLPGSQENDLEMLPSRGRINNLFKRIKQYGIAIIIICGYLLLENRVINAENIMILLRQSAILGFSVLGVYITTLCDGVNLSAGAQAAFAGMLVVFLTASGLSMWIAVIITIAVSMGLGVFYSYFTMKTGVPIVILSFGMMYVINGINFGIQSIHPGYIVDDLSFLVYGEIFHVPAALIVFTAFVVLLAILLKHTYWGRSIFAVGSNKEEARRSGLPVDLVKVLAYMSSFFLISITGLFFISRTSMASHEYGNHYFYDIVVALCIGRISLWGGKGSLTGVMLGTLCVILLQSYFTITGINFVNTDMIKGAIIIVMLLSEYRARKKLSIISAI